VFEPKDINGVRKLKRFTVDIRLKQFRRVNYEVGIEFLGFDSKKGQKLLVEMHKDVLN